jgi:hypothetical protein
MQITTRERGRLRASPELAALLAKSGAALAVVGTGSGIVAVLPDPSLWQVAAAYLAPAGLAFLVHWWNAQQP